MSKSLSEYVGEEDMDYWIMTYKGQRLITEEQNEKREKPKTWVDSIRNTNYSHLCELLTIDS